MVDQPFNIVPGVDGVVFIMVVIFVIGTIIFLAIIIAAKIFENASNLGRYFPSGLAILISHLRWCNKAMILL